MEKIRPVEISSLKHDYEKTPPIGIDLGTTNCVIAKWENTKLRISSTPYNHNKQGKVSDKKLLPSYLYLPKNEQEFLGGEIAYKRRISEPKNVVKAVKREIGKGFDEVIEVGGYFFSPIKLTTELVKQNFLDPMEQGLKIPAGIVVSVPYKFKQNKNVNTKIAIQNAINEIYSYLPESGRPKLLDIIPEPVAAAINYSLDRMHNTFDKNILVFDFGGGTLDITIFKLEINTSEINFNVLASDGNDKIGGEDFDEILMHYVLNTENILSEYSDAVDIDTVKRMVRESITDLKEVLSTEKNALFTVTSLPDGKYIDTSVRRSDFEKLLNGKNYLDKDFIAIIKDTVTKTITKATINKDQIDTVLLIGGSSKVPIIQNILKTTFNKAVFDEKDENRFYGVAKGAAIYAAYLLDQKYGHNHKAFNKEAVNIKFVFRTLHSLGIELAGGEFSTVISSNKIVPAEGNKIYKLHVNSLNNDGTINIPPLSIYQGDEKDAKENFLLEKVEMPIIYCHGRSLENIHVSVKFIATETNVDININIEQGQKDKSDITIFKTICLDVK